ncbi:MAG: M28 family peptidase [Streptosporangiaceae bacterium]
MRGLDIDEKYLAQVVEHLSAIGSSPLGFRTAGTPEDAAVAEYVAARLREIGLADVAVEDVEVDGWRFLSAGIETDDGEQYEAASFGGVRPTPPGGLSGALISIATGQRRYLDRQHLTGALVLLDWRDDRVPQAALALELVRRGVAGVVLNCPQDGAFYQSPGALGSFDSQWPAQAPPMIFIRKEDAAALRARATGGSCSARMWLDVERTPKTAGHNVVGFLPGQRAGPIVVGAHQDGWFRGAFDNASGVAVTLAIARALVRSGHRPRHTICFSTRTGEEYGLEDSFYDWCIGAWRQVTDTHPQWANRAPFHLCVEATGHQDLKMLVQTPVELAAWAKRTCRTAEAEGWLPTGWRIGPPASGTELWPFLVSGVPGVAAYAWGTPFSKTDYHTQFDTTAILDFRHMSKQARLHALLILDADRDPDAIIDHGARARELAAIATKTGPAGASLGAAANRHRQVRGRRAFTRIGRGLVALDARSRCKYPHEQAAADVTAIRGALDALTVDDAAGAARQLRKVGDLHLFAYLSESAFAEYSRRGRPALVARSWGSRSHLTTSPNLWRELASLLGQPGSRPPGPWLEASLASALAEAERERDKRLAAMARALGTQPPSAEARSS